MPDDAASAVGHDLVRRMNRLTLCEGVNQRAGGGSSELDASPNPATRNFVEQAECLKRAAVNGVAVVDEQ